MTAVLPTAPTLDEARDRRLPSPTDELAWNNPATVVEIAYWRSTVDPDAHAIAHRRPMQGCPGCPPVTECEWCGKPACKELAGHRRLLVSGEAGWWLAGRSFVGPVVSVSSAGVVDVAR